MLLLPPPALRHSPPRFPGRRGPHRAPEPPTPPLRVWRRSRGRACSPRCSKLASPPVATACGYRAGGVGARSHPRPSGRWPFLPALLAILVLVDDFGVLDQVVGVRGLCGLLLLGLAVEHLGELVGGRHQGLLLALDLLDVAAGERLLGLLDGLLYLQLGVRVDLAVHVL